MPSRPATGTGSGWSNHPGFPSANLRVFPYFQTVPLLRSTYVQAHPLVKSRPFRSLGSILRTLGSPRSSTQQTTSPSARLPQPEPTSSSTTTAEPGASESLGSAVGGITCSGTIAALSSDSLLVICLTP